MEKVVWALGYPACAFKGLNDYYVQGVEFEKANETSELFRKVKAQIEARDRKCRESLNFESFNILVAALFKSLPGDPVLARLQAGGFDIKKLPR